MAFIPLAFARTTFASVATAAVGPDWSPPTTTDAVPGWEIAAGIGEQVAWCPSLGRALSARC